MNPRDSTAHLPDTPASHSFDDEITSLKEASHGADPRSQGVLGVKSVQRSRRVQPAEFTRDDGHVIVTTYDPAGPGEMRAVDLATGEYETLVTEPQRELEVAPDGSKVNFLSAVSHYNMNLFVLRLSAGEDGSGLPRPAGAPEQVTHGDGEWHVHNGSWSPDGKFVAYTRDTDKADIYEVEGVWE